VTARGSANGLIHTQTSESVAILPGTTNGLTGPTDHHTRRRT
jgi:hypothetical protein